MIYEEYRKSADREFRRENLNSMKYFFFFKSAQCEIIPRCFPTIPTRKFSFLIAILKITVFSFNLHFI